MRTVKTFNGIRKIEDWDMNLVPLQVREILQEERKSLIERLFSDKGLEEYIQHRFNVKVAPQKALQIKSKLIELQHSGINLERYRSAFQTVLEKENSHIDSAIFFAEIDQHIQLCLREVQLEFDPLETFRIDHINLVQNTRQMLIRKILTETGLKNFVKGQYYEELEDREKMHYLIDELRDYFFTKRTDYGQMLHFIEVNHMDMIEGSKQLFKNEVIEILDKHFESKQG
jgi:hypothetical protein